MESNPTSAVTGRCSWPAEPPGLIYKDIPSKQHTRIFLHLFTLQPSLVKSLDRLVTVSSIRYRTFHLCPALSTSSSSRGLLPFGMEILSLGGFTLRCLQRLSLPDLATLLLHPGSTTETSGPSIPSSRTKDSSYQISSPAG